MVLTSVSIYSNNSSDTSIAYTGEIIYLNIVSAVAITPYVKINNTEITDIVKVVTANNNWLISYTVIEDDEGTVSFDIEYLNDTKSAVVVITTTTDGTSVTMNNLFEKPSAIVYYDYINSNNPYTIQPPYSPGNYIRPYVKFNKVLDSDTYGDNPIVKVKIEGTELNTQPLRGDLKVKNCTNVIFIKMEICYSSSLSGLLYKYKLGLGSRKNMTKECFPYRKIETTWNDTVPQYTQTYFSPWTSQNAKVIVQVTNTITNITTSFSPTNITHPHQVLNYEDEPPDGHYLQILDIDDNVNGNCTKVYAKEYKSYNIGETITLYIEFDKNVVVQLDKGGSYIYLQLDNGVRKAYYNGKYYPWGSHNSTLPYESMVLEYTYTVEEGDLIEYIKDTSNIFYKSTNPPFGRLEILRSYQPYQANGSRICTIIDIDDENKNINWNLPSSFYDYRKGTTNSLWYQQSINEYITINGIRAKAKVSYVYTSGSTVTITATFSKSLYDTTTYPVNISIIGIDTITNESMTPLEDDSTDTVFTYNFTSTAKESGLVVSGINEVSFSGAYDKCYYNDTNFTKGNEISSIPSTGITFWIIGNSPFVYNITISSNTMYLGDSVTITVVFSTSLSSDPTIEADNGTISDLSSDDDSTWTCTYTPDDSITEIINDNEIYVSNYIDSTYYVEGLLTNSSDFNTTYTITPIVPYVISMKLDLDSHYDTNVIYNNIDNSYTLTIEFSRQVTIADESYTDADNNNIPYGINIPVGITGETLGSIENPVILEGGFSYTFTYIPLLEYKTTSEPVVEENLTFSIEKDSYTLLSNDSITGTAGTSDIFNIDSDQTINSYSESGSYLNKASIAIKTQPVETKKNGIIYYYCS